MTIQSANARKGLGVAASPPLSHPFGAEPVPVSGKAGIANAGEGVIRFTKDGTGCYRVYSDCNSGTMQFVGYVEKNDRPLLNDRWWGRIPGCKRSFVAGTRLAAAEAMVRA